MTVREDPEADEVRPLGGYRRTPGQLDAPDLIVARYDGERSEGVTEARHERLNAKPP
jgi:hypothetical protein